MGPFSKTTLTLGVPWPWEDNMLLLGIAEGQKSGATASSCEKGSAFGTHPGLREVEQFHLQNGSQAGTLVETIMALCGGEVACIPLPPGCLLRHASTLYI